MSLVNAFLESDIAISELVQPLREVWLALRSDGDGIGDGSLTNPWAVNTPDSFAQTMRKLAVAGVPTLVHLGPGLFRTRGGDGNGYDVLNQARLWSPFPGCVIRGSGMFSTTLRFVWDLSSSDLSIDHPAQAHNMIVNFNDPLSSFELSDLTLDCGLDALPPYTNSYPITGSVAASGTTVTASAAFFTKDMEGKKITFTNGFVATITAVNPADPVHASINAGPGSAISALFFSVDRTKFSVTALSVAGDNIVVRRVRVINFGTRTPFFMNGQGLPNDSYEGFPIRIEGRMGNSASFNSLFESCIIEQPYPGPAREVTALVVGGGILTTASPPTKLHLQPIGCRVRNCYLNFDFINPRAGNPLPVSSVAVTAGPPVVVTIRTQFPHNLVTGDAVEIYGSNIADFNGRFTPITVLGPTDGSSQEFTFSLGSLPSGLPVSKVFAFKSAQATMQVSLAGSISSTQVTVTCPIKHNRLPLDWICITGASASEYNGTFQVATPSMDGLSFTYQLPANPSTGTPGGEIWLDKRPNSTVPISSVTPRSNNLAEIQTLVPHCRKPGEWIAIIGVFVNFSSANSYNSYVQIVQVNSASVFICQLPGNVNVGTLDVPIAQGVGAGFGTNYQAISANGGVGGGMLSNIIANANRGGTYQDFWWEAQFIARRNYYYNVYDGPTMQFGQTYQGSGVNSRYMNGVLTGGPMSGITNARLNDSTPPDPGFVPDLALQVQPSLADPINVAVVNGGINGGAYEFSYRFSRNAPEPDPFDSYSFFLFDDSLEWLLFDAFDQIGAYLWFQHSSFHFEDNVVETALGPIGGTYSPPTGIPLSGPVLRFVNVPVVPPPYYLSNGTVYGLNDPYIFGQVIIRDNIIRKVTNQPDPTGVLTRAMTLNSCESLIVEGNIIGEMNLSSIPADQRAHIIDYSNNLNAKAFNNQYIGGTLIQLLNDPRWDGNNEYFLDEIEALANDMVFSF